MAVQKVLHTSIRDSKENPIDMSNNSPVQTITSKAEPFDVPNYTMSELLNAIPTKCFERSTLKSSLYLLQSATFMVALWYAASFIDSSAQLAPYLFRVPAQFADFTVFAVKWGFWASYWWWQGLVMTGIWVIAHECGHQSFSPHKYINDSVGWVLHSALLVPYHSWRISHAKHHAATGHMTRDQVFVPKDRKQRKLPELPTEQECADSNIDYDDIVDGKVLPQSLSSQMADLLEDAPLFNLINLIAQQTLGWPMYLMFNSSGQAHYPANTNHFSPKSVIFDLRHYYQIIVSDIGLSLAITAIAIWGSLTSWSTVLKFYVIPYLFVNHWLVMITYLQHTDPILPHYRESENGQGWNFQRGALATIDRNLLGWVGPTLLHGICETHVAHHLVSRMPHYNAWEATEALKKFLGKDYHCSNENMFVSLWRSYKTCKYVENDGAVVFYKNAKGLAKRYASSQKHSISDSGIELIQ